MSALEQFVPEGYKQTDVGAIPENWKSEQLFELVKVIDGDRGHNYPSVNDFFADGYCVFLSASNVTKKGFSFKDISFINKTKDEALRKGKLKRNDIVLTTRGTVGQYAFYDEAIGYEHLRINSGMVLVRVISKEIKPDYLYSVLKSHIVQKQLSTMSFGSAQPQLTVRDINNFIVCYPSCSKEQTAIANALSDVDALLTELESLITKKQAIKTACMQQLLTGKTRLPQFATYTEGAIEEKSKGTKPSELGEIPEDWDVLTIEDALSKKMIIDQMDGNHGELYPKSHEFKQDGVPYVGATDFYTGVIDYRNCKKLPLERAKKFKKGIALNGDILFAHNATVGPTTLVDTKEDYIIISTTATYYRCDNDKIKNTYLLSFFKSDLFVKQFSAVMSQSTRNQVPILAQRKFSIVLPGIEEQTAIATILSDMDNEIQTLEQRLTKTRQIKQGMMQQLLTGRTRLPF